MYLWVMSGWELPAACLVAKDLCSTTQPEATWNKCPSQHCSVVVTSAAGCITSSLRHNSPWSEPPCCTLGPKFAVPKRITSSHQEVAKIMEGFLTVWDVTSVVAPTRSWPRLHQQLPCSCLFCVWVSGVQAPGQEAWAVQDHQLLNTMSSARLPVHLLRRNLFHSIFSHTVLSGNQICTQNVRTEVIQYRKYVFIREQLLKCPQAYKGRNSRGF